MKYKKFFIFFLIIIILPATIVWFFDYGAKNKIDTETKSSPVLDVNPQEAENFFASPINTQNELIKENQPLAKISEVILYDVPFTPQAPLGNWSDTRQQNACEEASVLMAMRWVEGRGLTLDAAEKEIIKISEFQLKNYGHFHDTSASDTIFRIFENYFAYSNIELKTDVSIEDIKIELSRGNLVIAPMNGQKLNNPFYVSPGPLQHMIVIIGYNEETNEFITNDPGTRRGKGFRYSQNNFYESMQDYPTGFHEPITKINKVIIVVKPNL